MKKNWLLSLSIISIIVLLTVLLRAAFLLIIGIAALIVFYHITRVEEGDDEDG